MGNHEYYDIWITAEGAFSTETMPNGKTDAASRERFMQFMGYPDKTYHSVTLNGVRLLMVSQEVYVQEKPDVGEGAWYSDEQFSWLQAQLEEAKEAGMPSFVFIHQPLPEAGTDGGTHRLIRARQFRSILEPYANVFVLSGHTHRDFLTGTHYTKETFHWFHNSSVGRCRGREQSASLAQGMYVQVYRDKVIVRGREFTDHSWIEAASWEVPIN